MPSIVIQATTPYTQYTINSAGQAIFNIPFQFLAAADLQVFYTPNGIGPNDEEQLLVLTTNYTVAFNPDYTGTLTLLSGTTFNSGNNTIGLVIGDLVTIVDAMSDQRLNYYINTAITANALNTDFESLVLMIKQNTLYNLQVAPHYNLTANAQEPRDIILPILGEGQCWVMDPTGTFIQALTFGSGSGGGGGSNVQNVITQAAHGFTTGKIVYFNGSSYVLAQADTAADAEVIGIVGLVISTNTFDLVTSGYVTQLPYSVTPGTTYFLSDATPGALTATEPTTVGHISKPLFIADTSSSGYFNNWRGKVIPESGGWSTVAIDTAMLPGNNYFTNGTVNMTLPATSVEGDEIIVSNIHASNQFTIKQAASQQIQFGNLQTTAGTGGSLTSTAQGDTVTLVCVTANLFWQTINGVGNITVT